MKTLLLTLAILSLSVKSFAQDNTISKKIENGQELVILNKINKVLFQSGYGILNIYKEDKGPFIFITTTEKPFKNGNIRLTIFVNNDMIYIKGIYRNSADPDFLIEIVNRGMINSPSLNAWTEMETFAGNF